MSKVGELDIIPGLLGVAGYPVSLSGIRNVLRPLGLHIVDGKDKTVLDAAAGLPKDDLEEAVADGMYEPGVRLAKAELARRPIDGNTP